VIAELLHKIGGSVSVDELAYQVRRRYGRRLRGAELEQLVAEGVIERDGDDVRVVQKQAMNGGAKR
jgi:hypothetical protein